MMAFHKQLTGTKKIIGYSPYMRFFSFFSISFFGAVLFFLCLPLKSLHTQPLLKKETESTLHINQLKTIAGSEAHFYLLSDQEGLAVFRAMADSLQWLYTSSGLAGRGNRLKTDIRFSYLFGKDNRLTIIEPASVHGVYSSTQLKENPVDLVRLHHTLFIATIDQGILKLSLETPEMADQTIVAFSHQYPIHSIVQIAGLIYALDNQNQLLQFEYQNEILQKRSSFSLPDNSALLFTANEGLYLSTSEGEIHRIRRNGRTDRLFGIGEEVKQLVKWDDVYLIRGESHRVWIVRQGMHPTLFRDDPAAGNFLTVLKDQLWIGEYNQVSRWVADTHIDDGVDRDTSKREYDTDVADKKGGFRITPVPDQVIPYPRPLLIPLSVDSSHPLSLIRFQQKSMIEGIHIRGNSLYWNPASSDIGTHSITIIAQSPDGASDSTTFRVNVRPFNSPPRFTPLPNLSIVVEEAFTIPFQANDPDGVSRDLIRYIGVDLPDGASLNEQEGIFSWTPTRRQTGEHRFQVIASDQYGAAASMEVKISVIDIRRDNEETEEEI